MNLKRGEVKIIGYQRTKRKGACLLSRTEGDSFVLEGGGIHYDISFFICEGVESHEQGCGKE